MVKKLFALASVTALVGLVSAVGAAGCSSDDTVVTTTTPDAATPDSSKKETGTPQPVGDSEPEPTTCMSTDPIDVTDATKFPYKKAGVEIGACTKEEAAALSKYFKDNASGDIKVSEWAATVSAKCGACVFSDGSGETWTPILTKDDALENVNEGGCFEVVSGKEACGKAYQAASDCIIDACITKCKTQDEFDACRQDTQSILQGPCAGAAQALSTDCGSKLSTYGTACSKDAAGKDAEYTFDAPIAVLCVTGNVKSDAGDGG